MKARLELTEERVKVHIERLQTLVTQMKADYNKLRDNKQILEVSFPEMEKLYNVWKKELEEKKLAISIEQDELDQLIHFNNFKHQPKPALVQPQVVKQKSGYVDGVKPLKSIKWRPIAEPILKELGRFIRCRQLFEMLPVPQTEINYRRFTVICSDYSTWFKVHKVNGKSFIGLNDWFDGDIPKPEFLKDFIGKLAV